MTSVVMAQTDAEICECWPVMAQLRPHLQEADFVPTVRQQFAQGYRLAFLRREGTMAAVAGFRVLQNLAWGRFCYVDDLVTNESARSQGCGAALFDWLCEYARSERCSRLELDSGVQRQGAHRFYHRQRMVISCYHLTLQL